MSDSMIQKKTDASRRLVVNLEDLESLRSLLEDSGNPRIAEVVYCAICLLKTAEQRIRPKL